MCRTVGKMVDWEKIRSAGRWAIRWDTQSRYYHQDAEEETQGLLWHLGHGRLKPEVLYKPKAVTLTFFSILQLVPFRLILPIRQSQVAVAWHGMALRRLQC
jgi:hypothetical protein